jgi:hypothetical protein
VTWDRVIQTGNIRFGAPENGEPPMKWMLFLWAMPLTLLGGWYYLSYYDLNFGYPMLSRPMHDLVFQIYGNVLGIPPADIPPLVMKAICIDSLLLFAFLAFKRRKAIHAWWRARQPSVSADAALARNDSLSSAP